MTRRLLGSAKVKEGKAKVPLTVGNPDYANGEYPLNVEYLENEYYEGSEAWGSLWHVYKTFIHCPTIYVYRGINETARLTANLYSNNNLLNEGGGNFIVEQVMLTTKTGVVNGSSYYEYPLKEYEDKDIPFFFYGFSYDGVDEQFREPVVYRNAKVIFVEYDVNKIPVSIQTYPVMGAKGDKVKLIARVYKTINGGTIDPPKDIPDNGYLLLYVNERYVGRTDFYESGYSTLEYTIIEDIGVYEYRVEYIPTNTKHYNKGFGANTLCVLPQSPNIVHATANIPTTSLGSTISFNINLDKTSCIDGLRLYIDDQLVSIIGTSTENNHTTSVENETVNVSFAIPENVTPSKRWAVEGTHAVFWEYTDTCTGITHYQWLDDMLIMFPSTIDFDYIARNTDEPYNNKIINEINGIPIVTPEIIGHIFNKKYPNKPVNDGKLTLDLEKMPTHITQTVNMIHVAPTVNSGRFEVDDKANTISTLFSNKDMGIPGRNVYIEVTHPNNTKTTQTSNTNTEGLINLNTTLDAAGTWGITTKYDGHKYEYDTTSSTKTFTVYKKDTILILEQNTTGRIYVDDTVSYTATLKCQDTPLTNQTIKISVGETQYTRTTNNEGKITFSHKHILNGNIAVIATFEETRKYNQAITTLTTSVNKLDVTITTHNLAGYVGDDLLETGTVIDERGNNVTGRVIITKENTQIVTAIIREGTFTYTHSPVVEETTTYTVTFEETYKYKQTTKTYTVTSRKLQTTLTTENKEIYLGETSIIPLTLLDENNNIPNRGTLTLKSGQTTLNNINLPNNNLQFQVTPNTKGNHRYTIEYNDTFRYEPSSTSSTITVKTLNTSISIPDKTVYVDDDAIFNISVLDENNEIPTTGTITIKQGNTIIQTINLPQTTIEFNLPTDTSGTTTYTAIYTSTTKYESSQTTFTLTINKKPVRIEMNLLPIFCNDTITPRGEYGTIKVIDDLTNTLIHEGYMDLYLQRERGDNNNSEVLVDYMLVGRDFNVGASSFSNGVTPRRELLELDDFFDANRENNYLIYSGYRLKAEYKGTRIYESKIAESNYGAQEFTSSNIRLEAKTIIDDDPEFAINRTITNLVNSEDRNITINKTDGNNKTFNIGSIRRGQTFYMAMDIRAEEHTDRGYRSIEDCDTVGGMNYDVHMILDADVERDTDETIIAGEEVDGVGTIIGKSGFRYGTPSYWKFNIPDSEIQHWQNVHQIKFIIYVGRNANVFAFGEDYGMKFTVVLNVEDAE